MGEEPFIGSEALAAGLVRKHELRSQFRAVFPNVYVSKPAELTLPQRATAGWLWSQRRGVVAGMTASALHGAECVDDDIPVELIWRNARAPHGVMTRQDLLFDEEIQWLDGLAVTTPERTAFDIARRGRVEPAVARLDALARATDLKSAAVEELAGRHRHARGLRQLEAVLDLMDPGAASPRETWLRLLLIRAGFPRPRTQIPVLSADGRRRYYLDMGWEDILLAVEYDGEQHRVDPVRYAYDIERSEDLDELGWTRVRVVKQNRPADIIRRVERAWAARTR